MYKKMTLTRKINIEINLL